VAATPGAVSEILSPVKTFPKAVVRCWSRRRKFCECGYAISETAAAGQILLSWCGHGTFGFPTPSKGHLGGSTIFGRFLNFF
jgi:hypothetical protein